MKGKRSACFATHFDLPAGDCAAAQNADALIIERMPFPAQIGCLKDGEFFFGKKRWMDLQSDRIKRDHRWFGNRHAV